jgi:hypothetical protein
MALVRKRTIQTERLLIEQCHLKGHHFKLDLVKSLRCERYLEEVGSVTHILCDCEAMAYLRFCHMGYYSMEPSNYHDAP